MEDCKILQAVLVQFMRFFGFRKTYKDESPWTYVAMTCIDRSKSRWTHKLYGLLVCMQMFCDVKTIGIKSMFVYNAMMTCLGWSPTYVYHFKGVFLSLDVTLSSQLQPNIVMLSQWAKTTTSHFLPPKITSTNSKCDKTAE